jgi:hypothetical protein
MTQIQTLSEADALRLYETRCETLAFDPYQVFGQDSEQIGRFKSVLINELDFWQATAAKISRLTREGAENIYRGAMREFTGRGK